jgi:hypothetical protein
MRAIRATQSGEHVIMETLLFYVGCALMLALFLSAKAED